MKAHGPADAVSAAKRAEGPNLDDFLLNIVAGGRLVSTRASHVAGVCVCSESPGAPLEPRVPSTGLQSDLIARKQCLNSPCLAKILRSPEIKA
jgi:hypothetical protein